MHSLTHIIKGGRGGLPELRDGTRKSDKLLITFSQICIQPTTSWLILIMEHLGVRTSHGQLWTHKTHHGSDSEEATTFPNIVFFAPLHSTCIQMVFYPRTPKEESRNYPNLDSRHFAKS